MVGTATQGKRGGDELGEELSDNSGDVAVLTPKPAPVPLSAPVSGSPSSIAHAPKGWTPNAPIQIGLRFASQIVPRVLSREDAEIEAPTMW